MGRALAADSILVLLTGAQGTGFLPPETPTPVPQPEGDREINLPQVIGVKVEGG